MIGELPLKIDQAEYIDNRIQDMFIVSYSIGITSIRKATPNRTPLSIYGITFFIVITAITVIMKVLPV